MPGTAGCTIHGRALRLHPVGSLRALHLRSCCRPGGLVNSRAGLDSRASRGCRLVIDCGPLIYGRLVVNGRLMIHCRSVVHCGLRLMRRGTVHCRLRLIRRSMMHNRRVMRRTGSRHTPGMMPRRAMRRHAHAMHMVRIMPMSMIPGGRSPVRYQAGSRNSRNGENSHTSRGITIHRLTVVVTVNREAIHIVSGICPRDSCATSRAAHADRCAGIHGIIIHDARGEQQCRATQHSNTCQFRFHSKIRSSIRKAFSVYAFMLRKQTFFHFFQVCKCFSRLIIELAGKKSTASPNLIPVARSQIHG